MQMSTITTKILFYKQKLNHSMSQFARFEYITSYYFANFF